MPDARPPRRRFLPAPETPAYHALLGTVALLVLGPLGGITAAYMTFSLGFFVGGQVLAGILGSVVTYGYGADGKHGANYMQTMAASVASMSGMAVLIQAMVWLKMPLPPAWQLVLFVGCIGMFGAGLGMLYTPILVDRMQLEYPSGHAVANILRALTDKRLLRRSIGKLGGGAGLGVVIGWVADKVPRIGATGVSAATVGAGMIVGSRITTSAAMVGIIGWALTPRLRAAGWLGPHDPVRKIGFLVALAMILGAAIVDLTLIGVEAVRRLRAGAANADHSSAASAVAARVGPMRTGRLVLWVVAWGAALLVVATRVLHQPTGFILFAMGLSLLFVLVNGIAQGISDSNPISSAFVICVLLMSALGLRDPAVGIMAAAILLISTLIGVDMQQDRSTGWRLGSSRAIQFRYQVAGITVGSVLCVLLATLFMKAYPVLAVDTFAHPEAKSGVWQSAMTFKFVGSVRQLGHMKTYQLAALGIGVGLGAVTETARKLLRRWGRYQRFVAASGRGFAVGWLLDAVLLPSPYASSFGGFVDLSTSLWFTGGGTITSLLGMRARGARRDAGQAAAPEEAGNELPEDMSATSLVGGGLIAGESLFALAAGMVSLLGLVH